MVVLNFFGKIEPTCISDKLKLYISNLPNEEGNEWRDEMVDWLMLSVKVSNIFGEYLNKEIKCPIYGLYHRVFPEKEIPSVFTRTHYQELADRMICIYFDYDYSDMPLGGWDTNCFDGRFCEREYAERIIDFMNFLAFENDEKLLKPCPQWIYSSDYDEIDHFRIFLGEHEANEYIKALIEFGELLDNFLCERNDYLLFNYLVNSIHEDHAYNEYHLLKAYSLCQLFLEKDKESELDYKLPELMDDTIPYTQREDEAKLLRKLRNKIAHGDFCAFENVIEEYAINFMDGRHSFDYSEYSRKNWVILHVCCLLDDIVQKLCTLLLNDKSALETIKNKKQ